MEGKKYSSDPRIMRYRESLDWEDAIENEADAELFFDNLRSELEKHAITLTADTKVLEIGSGNNVFLNYMQKQGLDATGIDARPRGEKSEHVAVARIEKLPFPNETFELIFANAVFDTNVYNQDRSAMINEIARVLKLGGTYIEYANFVNNQPPTQYFETLSEKPSFGRTIYRKK